MVIESCIQTFKSIGQGQTWTKFVENDASSNAVIQNFTLQVLGPTREMSYQNYLYIHLPVNILAMTLYLKKFSTYSIYILYTN